MKYSDNRILAMRAHLAVHHCEDCLKAASALEALWGFTIAAYCWLRSPGGQPSVSAEFEFQKAYEDYLKDID